MDEVLVGVEVGVGVGVVDVVGVLVGVLVGKGELGWAGADAHLLVGMGEGEETGAAGFVAVPGFRGHLVGDGVADGVPDVMRVDCGLDDTTGGTEPGPPLPPGTTPGRLWPE
ncbi:MAG: hypothetical protein ACM3ML_29350 [Micromonosporaceae bacterium]